ncbi:putative beta-amylase transcription factor BES/BZR family [Helianthus annuus]|uniref:Beta-amylase n=1 Tax=Helianthus annuus TaxID=4232 RepID=A0A251V3Z4_HELAN|nr:beta-amylase 7 [Helianthus annuus]XP_022035753.1 beta-amylase 7 [Helianthus annuus]KAF5811622.1 putative beta-amylase transcription factor BES/BZR family [Helianthus annuus]
METEMQRFGTSEEDDEDMGLDVKEEGENDEDDDERNSTPSMVGVDGGLVTSNRTNNRFQHQHQHQHQQQFQDQLTPQGGGQRRCRPTEEKERTKLRERQRRAITAKILAGLRRHGNYNLRVRADINDVIAALAREAGWVVLPDGTTFPSRSQGVRPATGASTTVVTSSTSLPLQQNQVASLRGISSTCQIGMNDEACQMKGLYGPSSSAYDTSASTHSQSSQMLGVEVDGQDDPIIGVSVDTVGGRQVDMRSKLQERDFAGTPYVPVYVSLPLGSINMKCELVDPDNLLKQLRILKSINVDGVMIDCWWGIVEAHVPQEYNWKGYKRLFQMARELKFKLQVVMSFHECGGNVGDDVCIPLPHWVAEIGRSNPDIFFTDRSGRHNPECLSWGIDKERVLRGRTASEVYFDYMRSFRVEFDDYFVDGTISMIEIGLGPCGELRYPSNPVKHGWRYPGVGEFQCYDRYMLKSLTKAAESRGHSFWARGPENAGSYNSRPRETGFFCNGGDYDSYYGRFFLNWYSQLLTNHADRVLSLAKFAFEGTFITVKLPGIHWWYKTESHAAELTAGFYNPSNRDGYAPVMEMLKKHEVALNFTLAQMGISDPHMDSSEVLEDPDGLAWQVMNAAWDSCIPIISENSLPCVDKVSYNHVLEKAKPQNDPDGRHYSAFTYLRLGPLLMEPHNIMEFERFIKRMHGEAVLEIHA